MAQSRHAMNCRLCALHFRSHENIDKLCSPKFAVFINAFEVTVFIDVKMVRVLRISILASPVFVYISVEGKINFILYYDVHYLWW